MRNPTRLTVAFAESRPFVVGSAIAGLTTTAFLLWLIVGFGGADLTNGVDDIGELVAALCAASACAVAAHRASGDRISWRLLAASSLAWAAGEAFWSYDDLVRGIQVPFPSLADVGFLSSFPLACAGLLLFSNSPRRAVHRIREVLDGCIIAMSLLFASWVTVLGPLLRTHRISGFQKALSLTYPMCDVVMLFLVVILLARSQRGGRMRVGLVMAGMASFAVSDSAFSYLTSVNNYGSGTFLDAGWVAGYLLIALAGLRAATRTSPVAVYDDQSTISLVAPYVPVLIVLAATAIQLLRGGHVGSVAWMMALTLALLVLVREGLGLLSRTRGSRPPSLRGQVHQATPSGLETQYELSGEGELP